MKNRRALASLLTGLGLAAVTVASTGMGVPQAAPERATSADVVPVASDNPLAGRTWGVYKGAGEQSWPPYVAATGTTKTLLGKIALRPKSKWFGGWIPDDQIAGKVKKYIEVSQAGDKEALVQFALFRMRPWEHAACKSLPTAAQRASYKRWMVNVARAIGDAHVAVIQQPDGPFTLCAPGGSRVYSDLIAYGTKVLSAQPNTSVYIDAGAADWPAAGRQGGVDAAVKILLRGGVKYARGFAMNSTHYSSTANEVARSAAISKALAAAGVPGKRAVINTSSNGHPFTFGSYTGADPDNAMVCRSRTEPLTRTCVTLGIPPTADVTNPRWRQSATTNRLAATYVDGYLWFGRPWLYRQNNPFQTSRAVALVKSTPY